MEDRRIGVDWLLFCCLAALADAVLRYVTHLLKLEA